MRETMRIWAQERLGRQNLGLTTAPVPEPRPGELRVKVNAVSLNYRDLTVTENGMGMQLAFPFVPASDMAGVVEAAGPGAARFAPGDRVIANFVPEWIEGKPANPARTPAYRTLGGSHPGVLAEYVVLPEDWLVAAPTSLDDAEASTLPVAGLTAWTALVERGQVRAGQTVVVQGTGGVALFGLQLAKAHGARVIVTSSSDAKLERARALGADHGVNRAREDQVEAVYRITGDRGADHILEIVGGAHLGRSIEAVASHGRISVIGVFDGFELSGPVFPLLMKSPTIQGILVGHRRSLEDLVAAVDALQLRPVVERRYAFDQAPEAFDQLERGPFGKVVIDVA